MRTDLGLEDFTESLRALDAELDARGYQGELEIRALGGFALLAHGLRESGYTADIDTATPDLTPVERAAVLAVAKALDLPPDWLNNDVVMGYDGETTWDDVDALDALDVMLEADYELLDLPGGPYPRPRERRHARDACQGEGLCLRGHRLRPHPEGCGRPHGGLRKARRA